MDSDQLIFDSSTLHRGHVLLFGGGNPIFRERSSKRPFFTSPDELLEEEYYDEQLPEKKRRLTAEQVNMLERSFEAENKLEPERKSELAKQLGMQPRQVAVWFQNRRARWKTKQLEQDFDLLKSSYDSLLADHHSLLKDNDRLRSQVLALTEKLIAREGLKPDEQAAVTAAAAAAVFIEQENNEPTAIEIVEGGKAVEDRLSAGTTGSGVSDGHRAHNRGQSDYDMGFVGPTDGGVLSEEDDRVSDEGCSLFSEPVFIENGNQFGDDVANVWWDWRS